MPAATTTVALRFPFTEESELSEQGARDREVKRLEEQHRRLASKLDIFYDDRLEGRHQSTALRRRIDDPRPHRHQPMGAIDMLALTSRTADLFMIQPPHEKQAFLRLVLKSAAWRHGELQTQFEEPFENLKRSNQLSRRNDSEIGDRSTRNQIWLPRRISSIDWSS
jgi:hypothetical protein